MSNAPVCHISTDQRVIQQPRPTLLPSVPAAVDLPSAIAAINALKLLIQMLSGQQPTVGPAGINGSAGLRGGSVTSAGAPGAQGQKGTDGTATGGRYIEDRSQRVEQTVRVFQDNDHSSENWVDVKRINRAVWVDTVTGEKIVWAR